jgi:hypothetical protein
LREKLLEHKYKPKIIAITKGVYDEESDMIYLREDARLDEHIHECLHFISTDPEKRDNVRTSGLKLTIKGEGDLSYHEGTLLNEAATVLLSIAAEHEIDVSRRRGISDLTGQVRSLQRTGRLSLAMSYRATMDYG